MLQDISYNVLGFPNLHQGLHICPKLYHYCVEGCVVCHSNLTNSVTWTGTNFDCLQKEALLQTSKKWHSGHQFRMIFRKIGVRVSLKGHFEGLCTRLRSLSFAEEPIDKVNAQKSTGDFQKSVPLLSFRLCFILWYVEFLGAWSFIYHIGPFILSCRCHHVVIAMGLVQLIKIEVWRIFHHQFFK